MKRKELIENLKEFRSLGLTNINLRLSTKELREEWIKVTIKVISDEKKRKRLIGW